MPQNLELKARITSIAEASLITRNLGAKSMGVLRQRDIYYNVRSGRLKLRIIEQSLNFNNRIKHSSNTRNSTSKSAELIFYCRPDKRWGRYSNYLVIPVTDLKLTNELCTTILGQKVIVEKHRQLFLYKNARIHIDEVRKLGMFVEFEVIVSKGRIQAQYLLKFLAKQFGIQKTDTIGSSYSELLQKKRKL